MESFKQKKILILAGASVHLKLVEAAKELGCHTIVTDYLDSSPAKDIADESWLLNISDVEGIVTRCREEHVDGIITGWIDPCQRPYWEICLKLGLPCLGTEEQFFRMTDKHAFKEMCITNDVNVIPEYTVDECIDNPTVFPVFVKPVDSRGSRGQNVCNNLTELKKAIIDAKSESSNDDILIEKYMAECQEFQLTYFYVNGTPYLVRTVDSYTGTAEDKMDKVTVCSLSPSSVTDSYIKNAHDKVIAMFNNLGIQNGPIFMQGFEDNGEFYFFDPGLRFPGVDYERIYKKVFGIDLMKLMVAYSLTGSLPDIELPKDGYDLNGNKVVILFPTLTAGQVGIIEGLDKLSCDDAVVSVLPRCNVGDKITWSFNVNQRLAEIDILLEPSFEISEFINRVQTSY
ncbi:MAG: ATP-grasp domain-containing protein, partial [Psychromonas sp.]